MSGRATGNRSGYISLIVKPVALQSKHHIMTVGFADNRQNCRTVRQQEKEVSMDSNMLILLLLLVIAFGGGVKVTLGDININNRNDKNQPK